MKKLILIYLLCVHFDSIAQVPVWSWGKVTTAAGTNRSSNSIAVDNIGNSFITGGFSTPVIIFELDTLINSGTSGTFDIYIVKYDINGNVIWAKNAGNVGNDFGNAITVGTDGSIYITGYYSSTITFGTNTLTAVGSSDVFILKMDSSGNVIWVKSAGGVGPEEASGICVDNSNNVFISGNYRNNTMYFETYPLVNKGYSDIFIARYDSNGNVIWAKDVGGYSDDNSTSVTIDATGNSYLSINYYSQLVTSNSDTVANNNSSMAIIKFNINGNIIWSKTSGYYNSGWLACAKTDQTGNIYLVGYFVGNHVVFGADTIQNTNTNANIFIVKYDMNGNVIWTKGFGNTGIDHGSFVTTDSFNNLFIGGFFTGTSIVFDSFSLTNTANGSPDIFITKLDSLGNVTWAKSAASQGDDYLNSIGVDILGNIFTTGYYHASSIVFDNDTLFNPNFSSANYYIYLAKINESISTNITPSLILSVDLNIFPNPAKNSITISQTEPSFNKYEIYSLNGKLVKESKINGILQKVDLTGYAEGMYIVKLIGNQKVELKKIVITE